MYPINGKAIHNSDSLTSVTVPKHCKASTHTDWILTHTQVGEPLPSRQTCKVESNLPMDRVCGDKFSLMAWLRPGLAGALSSEWAVFFPCRPWRYLYDVLCASTSPQKNRNLQEEKTACPTYLKYVMEYRTDSDKFLLFSIRNSPPCFVDMNDLSY